LSRANRFFRRIRGSFNGKPQASLFSDACGLPLDENHPLKSMKNNYGDKHRPGKRTVDLINLHAFAGDNAHEFTRNSTRFTQSL
jgi:hypothetical protein